MIKNTHHKYTRKYGCIYITEVNITCNVKCFDKTENKTKIFMIDRENVIGIVNKIMQSSEGMVEFIRVLELTIRIQERIQKNVHANLKCDNIPILWKKHYLTIAHDGSCKFNQNCREKYFHDFTSCNGCIWKNSYI